MSLGISKDFLSHSKERHFKDNEHNKKTQNISKKPIHSYFTRWSENATLATLLFIQ